MTWVGMTWVSGNVMGVLMSWVNLLFISDLPTLFKSYSETFILPKGKGKGTNEGMWHEHGEKVILDYVSWNGDADSVLRG